MSTTFFAPKHKTRPKKVATQLLQRQRKNPIEAHVRSLNTTHSLPVCVFSPLRALFFSLPPAALVPLLHGSKHAFSVNAWVCEVTISMQLLFYVTAKRTVIFCKIQYFSPPPGKRGKLIKIFQHPSCPQ